MHRAITHSQEGIASLSSVDIPKKKALAADMENAIAIIHITIDSILNMME